MKDDIILESEWFESAIVRDLHGITFAGLLDVMFYPYLPGDPRRTEGWTGVLVGRDVIDNFPVYIHDVDYSRMRDRDIAGQHVIVHTGRF